MCYQPTRRTVNFTQRAIERIKEGKLVEAERLINAAASQGQSVMSVKWQGGLTVSEHISAAREALAAARLRCK